MVMFISHSCVLWCTRWFEKNYLKENCTKENFWNTILRKESCLNGKLSEAQIIRKDNC